MIRAGAQFAGELPATRETTFKAKQVIDTFCVRGGDVLQAAVVDAGGLRRSLLARARHNERAEL
jgi:hypothetical protein